MYTALVTSIAILSFYAVIQILAEGYKTESRKYILVVIAILAVSQILMYLADKLLPSMGRLLRLPRARIPSKVQKWVSLLRYVLLGLSILGIAAVLLAQSPFASFMGIVDQKMGYITETAWIILGTILVLSLIMDRPFCRYFCPEGARYGLISLARVFTIKRDREKCVSCGRCDARCPSQIEVSKHREVRNAQCINCMECIAACPIKGTLKFGWAFGDLPERKNKGKFIGEVKKRLSFLARGESSSS